MLQSLSTRFYSQAAATTRVLAAPRPSSPALVHYPYFLPRNSQGNLPVYTDVRNGGSRYLVLIRNIDGNADVSEPAID
jgi:hypothetical protein